MTSVDRTSDIVLIPGVGGTPRFHQELAAILASLGRLTSGEHGDFRAAPFPYLADHVAVWRQRIENLGGGPTIIVGVSFGSFIAADLMRSPPLGVSHAILISFWPIGRLERAILRLLKACPRTLASLLVGKALFAWSERTADDKAALRSLRRTLYDDERRVFDRLIGRLLCLLDTSFPVGPTLVRSDTTLVYGRRELAFRLHRRALEEAAAQASMTIVTIDGGHAISTRRDNGLEMAMKRVLHALNRRSNKVSKRSDHEMGSHSN